MSPGNGPWVGLLFSIRWVRCLHSGHDWQRYQGISGWVCARCYQHAAPADVDPWARDEVFGHVQTIASATERRRSAGHHVVIDRSPRFGSSVYRATRSAPDRPLQPADLHVRRAVHAGPLRWPVLLGSLPAKGISAATRPGQGLDPPGSTGLVPIRGHPHGHPVGVMPSGIRRSIVSPWQTPAPRRQHRSSRRQTPLPRDAEEAFSSSPRPSPSCSIVLIPGVGGVRSSCPPGVYKDERRTAPPNPGTYHELPSCSSVGLPRAASP